MSGSPTASTQQCQPVARYPDLFNQEINGRVITPGHPGIGDGWRDLVETAIARIAAAAVPAGSLRVGQLKQKFGTLRLYLDNHQGLPEAASAAIDEAISLAEVRSAYTCGEPPGYSSAAVSRKRLAILTREARPPELTPGRENVHIVRSLKDGKLSIVNCRRYIRETDSFVDIAPAELGTKQ
jgi:hypothetical protein